MAAKITNMQNVRHAPVAVGVALEWVVAGFFALALCVEAASAAESVPSVASSVPLLGTRPVVPFADVLRAAVAQSLAAKKAGLARDAAALRMDLVGTKSLPDLNLSGTWAARRPELAPAQRRDQSYSARLTHTVWDFGRTRAELDRADAEAEVQSLTLQEIEDRLKWQVARGYQSLLTAKIVAVRTRDNLTLSEKKFTEIRDNYRHGLRTKADLVGAEADRATSTLNLARAENDVAIQERQLAALVGLQTVFGAAAENASTQGGGAGGAAAAPRKSALEIRGPEQWDKIIASWPTSIVSAGERRISAELVALRSSEAAISASRNPNLDVSMDATHAGSWEETAWVYSGQLQLSWEIPWKGQQRIERRLLANQRASVEADRESIRREKQDLTSEAQLRLRLAGDLWRASARQLEFKEAQFTLTQERYQAGRATILELSNHELELGNARLEQVRIAGTLAASALDLAEAIGLEDLKGVFHDAS